MIRELVWDSAFFGRKMGELVITSGGKSHMKISLDKAKANGFEYLTCKMTAQDTALIRLLESSGFYLADIGVILSIRTETFSRKAEAKMEKSIRPATREDIPMLKRMIKSLFLESRFYSDPFFTKDEADNLYQTWIENSVKGQTADVVLCIPYAGFVTCKKSAKDAGEVVLIGVRKAMRGKGIGSILMEGARQWFSSQNVRTITVRTQLRNIKAMKFYIESGFSIKSYDIVFGKILV